MAQVFPDITFETIDAESDPDEAARYNIRAVPTFILSNDDICILKLSGNISPSLLEFQISQTFNNTSVTNEATNTPNKE